MIIWIIATVVWGFGFATGYHVGLYRGKVNGPRCNRTHCDGP